MVVKSKKRGDLLDDLRETFDNLRKYKICLTLKNMCLVYHQENCSSIWYQLEGSMQIQRRWRPSKNCNHHKPEEEIQKMVDMMASLS
jgi:hypothetical protein